MGLLRVDASPSAKDEMDPRAARAGPADRSRSWWDAMNLRHGTFPSAVAGLVPLIGAYAAVFPKASGLAFLCSRLSGRPPSSLRTMLVFNAVLSLKSHRALERLD